MELKARLVVEGFIAGLHKSPYHGFSVEFAEHRQYMPGDNIRDIDWKVYAKSDRYYIKQYEEETNLTVFGVLANLLINYNPLSSGGFFLVGAPFLGSYSYVEKICCQSISGLAD